MEISLLGDKDAYPDAWKAVCVFFHFVHVHHESISRRGSTDVQNQVLVLCLEKQGKQGYQTCIKHAAHYLDMAAAGLEFSMQATGSVLIFPRLQLLAHSGSPHHMLTSWFLQCNCRFQPLGVQGSLSRVYRSERSLNPLPFPKAEEDFYSR